MEAEQFVREFLNSPVLMNDVRAKPVQRTERELESFGQKLEKAAKNPDTNDFDTLINLTAGLLRNGGVLPNFLAIFAADVLEGKRKRPTSSGPDQYKNWGRDYKLWRAVKEVAEKYKMPFYTNNGNCQQNQPQLE